MPPKRATRSTNSVSKTSAPSAPAPKRGAKRSAPVEANLPSASKRAKNGIKAEDAEDEEHKCDHGSQSDSELSDLEDEDSDAGVKKPAAKKKAVAKGKVKTEEKEETGNKRKRKTQEEKDAEMVPLAARTKALKMFVGAHVSAAKGMITQLHSAEAGIDAWVRQACRMQLPTALILGMLCSAIYFVLVLD